MRQPEGRDEDRSWYRNWNGKIVFRRTDTPGNEQDRVVYELECGGCGERYGANGPDI